MNIDITGRNINISSDLKELIYERVNKLLKYDKKIISAKVVLLKDSTVRITPGFMDLMDSVWERRCSEMKK